MVENRDLLSAEELGEMKSLGAHFGTRLSNHNERSTNEPPAKHSEAYFEERIKSLQTQIKKFVPSRDELIETENNTFLTILSALESAKKNLDATENVQKLVLKEQKEHSDDDGYALLLDPLKEIVQEGQSCIQDLEDAATKAANAIVKDSGLVSEGRSLLHIQDMLLECTVLIQATPKKLADWCALSSPKNGKLLDAFLANDDGSNLMVSFLREGGPSHGKYGPALTIYDQLQSELQTSTKKDAKLTEGSLALKHRLALAVALELANEVQIFKQDTFVDPLERFRYFAKFADTNGTDHDKLDDAFYELSVWELRKVVDANATHDDLTWGREYLRNYRPDQITMQDQKWRYVKSVRTDVGYRHPDHNFENYPELLSAGGECGPRAFFGRFISKAWGMPTWGVRQPGHAAMTRYTQDSGWVVCLGAGWSYSWWDDDRYCGNEQSRTRHGPDFLEESQARGSVGRDVYYQQVVLMECLAEIQGETVEEDFATSTFWRSLALGQRKKLAKNFSVGKKADFSSTTKNKHSNDKDNHKNDSLTIHHLEDGTIVIPAASFVDPINPSNKVMILESFLGGQQLHLEHDGAVEYEFPKSVEAGTYELSAKVCNVHENQKPLLVEVENCSIDIDDGYELIPLPQGQEMEVLYTKGYWEETQSIRVDLGDKGGKLKFSRSDPCWGLSIREFLLKPVKSGAK